jgi:transcriptional regulator with XRE-family HTH domain
MEVGKNIRKIREKRGITLQDLADKLGISKAQLSRLETGHRPIKTEMVVEIAELLSTPIGEFFSEPKQRKIIIDDEEVLIIDRKTMHLEEYTEEQIRGWIEKGKQEYEKNKKQF